MSVAREEMETQDRRRRQARAEADRVAHQLAQDLGAALIELEDAAAKLALGSGDLVAVEEAEADLDRIERALRRSRAAVAGLSA